MTRGFELAAKAAMFILFQESVLAAGASLRRVVPGSSNYVDDVRPLPGSRAKISSEPLRLLGALKRSQAAHVAPGDAPASKGGARDARNGTTAAVANMPVPRIHATVQVEGAGTEDKGAQNSGSKMGPQTREVINKTHNVLKDRFGRFRLQKIMKEAMNDEVRPQYVHTDWLNESVARNPMVEEPEWTSHCKCPEYQWFYADHPSHPMCMNKGHAGYACGFYPSSSQASSCGFGLGCIDGSWCAQCTKDDECACGGCDKLTGECDRTCQDKECVTVTVFADDAANASANATQTVTVFWDMHEELGDLGGAGAAGHATEAPIEGNFTTTATASALKQVIKRAIVTAAQCQPCGETLEGTRAQMIADSEKKALAELTNKTQPEAKRSCEVESQWRAEQEARTRAYRKARKAAQALVNEAKAKVRKELESKKMPGSGLTDRLFR